MKQLAHNGILVPKYETKGFLIFVKGKKIYLTPEQEEVAVAWVKKQGTVYVQDPVFVKNFFHDFRQALGMKEKAPPRALIASARPIAIIPIPSVDSRPTSSM